MVHRSVPLLLVVLVAVVGGCSGADSVGDGTTSLTDSTETGSDRYPTGVTDAGVNASAVAAAHERALRNHSVTVVAEWHEVWPNGEDSYRLETYVSGDRRSYLHRNRFSYQFDETAGQDNTSKYLYDGFIYVKTDTPVRNESFKFSEYPLDESLLVGADFVNETLSSAAFAPAERQNGSDPVLRATADNLPSDERENVTAYNATVRIDSDGVVRSIEINSTTIESGKQVKRRHEVRVTDIGTTDVPEPSWFDEARSTLPEPIEPPEVPGEEVLDSGEDYESGSVVSHELGAAASVIGSPDLIETASISEWSHAFAQDPLPYAVSTPVEIRADAPAKAATIKLRYNESAIPGRDESGLAIYRFNHTIQTFVPLESSVDPANDTVTAEGRDVLDEYEYVDGQYLSAFAVFHVASWEAMWETDAPSEQGESTAENVTLKNGVDPPADVQGVERARVSNYVYFDPGSSPGEVTLEIGYNESAVSGDSELRLAIYRYNETQNTYVYVNLTLHLRDDVATAEPTEPGTYVVLHEETWESEKDE